MRHIWQLWLYVWAAPGTCVGLTAALVALQRGARFQVVDGVLEVACPHVIRWISRFTAVGAPISAITLGHVVVAESLEALDATRRHERIHVRQYERWGPLFIPAYFVASGWAWSRGRHPYLDNPFEVEAFALSVPPRDADPPLAAQGAAADWWARD